MSRCRRICCSKGFVGTSFAPGLGPAAGSGSGATEGLTEGLDDGLEGKEGLDDDEGEVIEVPWTSVGLEGIEAIGPRQPKTL